MSKFKVGELAWSPIEGFAKIEELESRRVDYIKHGQWAYLAHGRIYSHDAHPTLLTVEEAAKLGYFPPKKKVTKTIEGWINIYENGRLWFHESEEEATTFPAPGRIACVRVSGTYEVEE